MSRKRSLDNTDLVTDRKGKKVRLDDLMQDLTIDEVNDKFNNRSLIRPKQPQFRINADFNEPNSETASHNINAYLTQRIIHQYTQEYKSQLAIIPHYDRFQVLMNHLHCWILRLFNRFIVKYNKSNNTRIGKVRSFLKILQMIHLSSIQFNYYDLMTIIDQENHLEAIALQKRLAAAKSKSVSIEEIEEESFTFNDVRYNYWDKISNLDQDIDMEEDSDDMMV